MTKFLTYGFLFQSVTKTGRLFDSYNGLFYEPNSYLASDYPDDANFCRVKMESFLKEKPEPAQLEWSQAGME